MQTKILAVDYGTRRTGIAVSDVMGIMAHGMETFHSGKMEEVAQKVLACVQSTGAGVVVIGYPKNMNNTVGERGDAAKALAEHIEPLTDAKVVLWDERLTTVQAIKALNVTNTRGKKRKAVVDTVAAELILQNYLDYINKGGNSNG